MPLEMEGPAATGMANGANIEAADFCKIEYRSSAIAATPFKPIGTAALRVTHLVSRLNVAPARATLLSDLIWGCAP